MQHNRTAYSILFLTTLFWGGNAVAGKFAVGHVSPMVLTSLRWAIAFTILVAIGSGQFLRERHLVRPHIPLLFVYGALGFSIFNFALFSALTHTTAINVAIEQAGIPAIIFLGNYILFRTRITMLQIIGFGLSIVGVAVVASQGSFERLAGLQINRGDAFMVLGIISYSAYSVLLKYKPALHWKSMMLVMSFSAFLISLPFSYWELHSSHGIWPDTQGWAVTLYAAILPAIVSQVLWIKGVEMIGANRAGIFINLVPILGTLLAIALLGEVFQLYHAVALLLAVGGIWIAENSGRKINNG